MLAVCADCVYVSANGSPDYEGYLTSGHAQRYAQGLARWNDEPCCIDGDESFSRSACDYCGDTFAGSRYVASVMELHLAD